MSYTGWSKKEAISLLLYNWGRSAKLKSQQARFTKIYTLKMIRTGCSAKDAIMLLLSQSIHNFWNEGVLHMILG